jgi:hypothetical protein
MNAKLLVIAVVFILGLIVASTKTREPLTTQCPNLLIKKDGVYYLKNTRVPNQPPITFNSLDDYVKFVDIQRKEGMRCPVLYLQQTADAQGTTSYRMMPDPRELNGGLSTEQFPANEGELKRKLTDASRLSNIFNRGLYPGYDPTNQDIGVETPLDKIFTSTGALSDNPMDPNWGGADYSRAVVKTGKYEDENIKIWVS